MLISIKNEKGIPEIVRITSNKPEILLAIHLSRDKFLRLAEIQRRLGCSTLQDTISQLIEMYEDIYVYGLYVDDEIGEE